MPRSIHELGLGHERNLSSGCTHGPVITGQVAEYDVTVETAIIHYYFQHNIEYGTCPE